jgi:hypothetical protein
MPNLLSHQCLKINTYLLVSERNNSYEKVGVEIKRKEILKSIKIDKVKFLKADHSGRAV